MKLKIALVLATVLIFPVLAQAQATPPTNTKPIVPSQGQPVHDAIPNVPSIVTGGDRAVRNGNSQIGPTRQQVDPHLTPEQQADLAESFSNVQQAMEHQELVVRRIAAANDLGNALPDLRTGLWYSYPRSTDQHGVPTAPIGQTPSTTAPALPKTAPTK